MNFTLKVWRQSGPKAKGRFETYPISNISSDCSFLEMLDILNKNLVSEGKEPVCFDHDCREGICGMCSCTNTGACEAECPKGIKILHIAKLNREFIKASV